MEFGGSWFVVVVFYVPAVLYCSTDLQYMCSKQKHKAGHGHKKTRRGTHHEHKKGTHPRASQGRALRCQERSKHIAPKPRIARAPELVSFKRGGT